MSRVWVLGKLSCKFYESDLSHIHYTWDKPETDNGEIIYIFGSCEKCGQEYYEKYEYLGYEKLTTSQ